MLKVLACSRDVRLARISSGKLSCVLLLCLTSKIIYLLRAYVLAISRIRSPTISPITLDAFLAFVRRVFLFTSTQFIANVARQLEKFQIGSTSSSIDLPRAGGKPAVAGDPKRATRTRKERSLGVVNSYILGALRKSLLASARLRARGTRTFLPHLER